MNNNILFVSFLLTPRNIEHLIATSYINCNKISVPIINNDHELLNYVSSKLNKEIKEIVSDAVNLPLNPPWIHDLKSLLEKSI